MNKRNLWKYDETMEMLLIMQENNYPRMFSSRHNKNMQIFRMVEKEMTQRGYKCKTSEQICVRWKNLKNLYMKVKRSNSKNEQEMFPFYNEMDDLIGQKGNKSPKEDTLDNDTTSTALNETPAGCQEGTSKSESILPDVIEEVPVRSPKRSGKLFGARNAFERCGRPISRLEATLASSKQELSDEFYRTQKRLIDYEFNLYMQKEVELIDHIQESTKTMLQETMDRFFRQLENVVGQQSPIEHVELMGSYEDHSE